MQRAQNCVLAESKEALEDELGESRKILWKNNKLHDGTFNKIIRRWKTFYHSLI